MPAGNGGRLDADTLDVPAGNGGKLDADTLDVTAGNGGKLDADTLDVPASAFLYEVISCVQSETRRNW